MKKKILRLFICFLATISCFLFNNDIVKAADKITVDVNGVPGTGGSDPCDQKKSLVCIYNLAAVRISYYEGNTYKAGADFYEDNAYSESSKTKLSNGELKKLNIQRETIAKGKNVNYSYLISMVEDFDKKNFVSEGNQKRYYNKLIKALGKQEIDADINGDGVGDYHVVLIENILKKLVPGKTSQEYYKMSINKNNRFVIEPLYRVQIQEQSDALAGIGKWKYGAGTAYTIAHEIVDGDYYKNCKNTGLADSKCKLGWKTRSDKKHVGRLANSLRLTSKWNGIATVNALKRKSDDYSLITINNPKKGYGMAVFQFSPPTITRGNMAQYCYGVENDGCNSANGDYDISVKTADKIEDVATCLGNVDKNSNYSSSEFGAVEKNGNKSVLENDYCALYCEKEISFDLPKFGEEGGTKKPNWSTIDNSDKYKITKTTNYECKVDFKYYYTADNNKLTSIANVYGSQNRNGFRPTKAQAEIAEKITELRNLRENNSTVKIACGKVEDSAYGLNACYETVKSEISGLDNIINNCSSDDLTCSQDRSTWESEKKDLQTYKSKYEEWESLWGTISNAYSECVTKPITEKDFNYTAGNISVSDTDGNKYTLNPKGENFSITGGESKVVKNLNQIVEEAECNSSESEYFKKYRTVCGVNYLEDTIESRSKIRAYSKLTWENDINKKVNLNLSDPTSSSTTDNGYSIITNGKTTDLASGSLNYCSWDLNKYNKNFGTDGTMDNTITFDFSRENEIAACIGNNENIIKIKKSNTQQDCACPPNTKHSGTNAYYWYSNNKITDSNMETKFTDGITCTEAQELVCNSDLPKTDTGYEEIENGEGCSMQDCLQAGNPYEYCSMMACQQYICDIKILGKTSKVYTQYDVYKKIHEKYDTDDLKQKLKQMSKEDAEKIANEIAKEVCQENSCDNDKNKTKTNFVYRTVELNDGQNTNVSFPGLNGNGRKSGSNWTENSIKTILNKNRIKSNDPMYKIVLDSKTINNVRNYNKQQNNDYGSYNGLDCNDNDGSACISDFLRNTISVSGRCSKLGKENFYSNCN